MNEPESKSGKPEKERRYDPELLKKGLRCDMNQYEMLRHCSAKKDVTEWNEWRKKHMQEEIWLEGSDFGLKDLRGIDLSGASDEKDPKKLNKRGAVHLKEASFWRTNLQGANLHDAHAEGALFYNTDLRRTWCKGIVVDSSTVISGGCKINKDTNFEGVTCDVASLGPGIKLLLEYNIRRRRWEFWYTKHPKLKWLVKLFWWISDYGISTKRIIITFFGLAFLFAAVYSIFAFLSPPGIVSNLEVEPHLPLWHYFILLLLRPIYFSVVTMTTLGFGDMYANAQSIWGHILLTFQVILGYVLLGALVTRFAVLFTAGGPAGKFADEQHAKTLP